MDRKKIVKELETVLSCDPLNITWDLIDETIAFLKWQPEIVRCKDCKLYDERISMCDNCGLPRERNFFCADGERKEGVHE